MHHQEKEAYTHRVRYYIEVSLDFQLFNYSIKVYKSIYYFDVKISENSLNLFI